MILYSDKSKELVGTNRFESWFAWYPVKTVDGHWVWLEEVYRNTYYWWGKITDSLRATITYHRKDADE